MGPKKKGKAPKKTKEELEEERRLQEEEEARLRAEEEKRLEEERKEREVDAARRREEEIKSRAAELERLAVEHGEAKFDLEAKAQRLDEILRAQKEAREWSKYLACEPRPDAQVEGDMNSFLNSWLLEDSTELPEVTSACEDAHQVIRDLVVVAANARAMNDTALNEQCTMFIDKIQRMILDKMDYATAHVLQYADEYTDINSRSEVKMASACEWVKLGLWINLTAKGSRNKRIDFTELGISVDLPKAIIVQSLALRATYLPYDQLSSTNASNLDVALGGVLTLDLLAIPAPPKRARGWMMREVADAADRIQKLHYPLEGMVSSAAMPVKVNMQLPNDVLFAATPRVGWWDPQTQCWEEDGITEIVLNPTTRILSFNTMHVTHLAVVEQRDLNHQKFRWQLQMNTTTTSSPSPIGSTNGDGKGGLIATTNDATATTSSEVGASSHAGASNVAVNSHMNRAFLELQTEYFDCIRFEVTDAGCRLVAPVLPPWASLQKDWLPPGELLMRLRAAGLGLCPSLEDDVRFEVTPKLKMLEDRMIQEVVSIVSAYEVSIADLSTISASEDSDRGNDATTTTATAATHQWISAVDDPRKIVVAVREIFWPYLHDEEVAGSVPASNALEAESHPASGGYVNVLTEVDDDASGGSVKSRTDRSEDAYDTHVHLKRALEEISSPDARDRMENSNVLFEFVLRKLLSLLRLFSYSRPICNGSEGVVAEGEGEGGDDTVAVEDDEWIGEDKVENSDAGNEQGQGGVVENNAEAAASSHAASHESGAVEGSASVPAVMPSDAEKDVSGDENPGQTTDTPTENQ